MKTHLAFAGRRRDRLRPPPLDVARALARVRSTPGVLAVAFGPHIAGTPHRRAILQRTLALAELAAEPVNARVDDAVVFTGEKRKCALAVAAGHAAGKSARRLLRQLERERERERERAPAQAQIREAKARAPVRAAVPSAQRPVLQMHEPRPQASGSHLLGLLRSRGLSAREAAQRVGVSSVSLYYWSSGRHAPRAGKLARLAEVLQVDSAALREVLALDAARAAP